MVCINGENKMEIRQLSLTEWCVDLDTNNEFQQRLADNKFLYVSYFITESITEEKRYGKRVYPRHGHVSYLILCEPKYTEQLLYTLGRLSGLWHSSPHIVLLNTPLYAGKKWYLKDLHCLIMTINYINPLNLKLLPASMKDDKHVLNSQKLHFEKLSNIEEYLSNTKSSILSYFTTYIKGETIPKTEKFYIFVDEDSLQKTISTLERLDFGRIGFEVSNYTNEELSNNNINPELMYLSSEHSLWRAVDGDNLISYELSDPMIIAASNVDSQNVLARGQETQKQQESEHKKINTVPAQPAKDQGTFPINDSKAPSKENVTTTEPKSKEAKAQKQSAQSAFDKIDKIFDYLKIIVTIIAVLCVGSVFFNTCHGPTQKVEKYQSYSSTVRYTDYGDKLPEMISSFSTVYAENPNSFVLQSVNWKKPDVLILNINSNWYAASKGQKKATIESAMKIWNGMAGARGIHVNVDDFEVHVIDPSTGKKVAKWGSVMGTQIDE